MNSIQLCNQPQLSPAVAKALSADKYINLFNRFESLFYSNEDLIASIMPTAVWSKSSIWGTWFKRQRLFNHIGIDKHNMQAFLFFHQPLSCSIDKNCNEIDLAQFLAQFLFKKVSGNTVDEVLTCSPILVSHSIELDVVYFIRFNVALEVSEWSSL